MSRVCRCHAFLSALCMFASVHAYGAAPSNYPEKPIRVITGAPVGSGSDVLMRLIAQQMSESLGRSVVVDNRTGAVGSIALELAAGAAPDGYTLMICSTQNFTGMLLKTVHTDIPKVLSPISMLGVTPYLLVVTPSLPPNSVKEFIEYAKSKPLVYASSGVGSAVHLAMELFKSMAKVQMSHVPYKGSSQSVVDLMSGRVQVAFTNTLTATPLVKGGKLKALGITSAKRSANLPGIPTISESGVTGYESSTWYGLFAPIRTTTPVMNRIHSTITRITEKPEMREKLSGMGIEPPETLRPEQMSRMIDGELKMYSKVIREADIKAE